MRSLYSTVGAVGKVAEQESDTISIHISNVSCVVGTLKGE